ncbi:hypothetical protein, partial [Vibrio cholerae]|uniref:hypothetical protein n=1 Tax=Vibrio cholerae TaxID=666 RepID=UPI0018F0C6A2
MTYRTFFQSIVIATVAFIGAGIFDAARAQDAAFERIPIVNIPLPAWAASRGHQSPDTLPEFS